MNGELILTRARSIEEVIEHHIREARGSIAAALYRLNNPRLVQALEAAQKRGVQVRLVLDRSKYGETPATRELLVGGKIPFRLSYGRQGQGSKMHHKFAIVDDRLALAGSYNWTLESEEQNYESFFIIREPKQLESLRREFEALWSEAGAPS